MRLKRKQRIIYEVNGERKRANLLPLPRLVVHSPSCSDVSQEAGQILEDVSSLCSSCYPTSARLLLDNVCICRKTKRLFGLDKEIAAQTAGISDSLPNSARFTEDSPYHLLVLQMVFLGIIDRAVCMQLCWKSRRRKNESVALWSAPYALTLCWIRYSGVWPYLLPPLLRPRLRPQALHHPCLLLVP